jgi:hypothetical protein
MKFALVFGAILLGGAAVGVVVERTGLYSPLGEPVVAGSVEEVPFHLCPGDGVVGVFHGGDRVLITGRSGDGGWLEVRAPFDTGTRVWVETEFVIPDSDVSGVPTSTCEEPVVAAPASTTTTTEPPSTTTTTTTEPPPTTTTTTTQPPPTTTTTTTEPPPPPPPPADTEGPTISFFQANEDEIWENASYGNCNSSQPRTVQVGAVVVDESGIDSVRVHWGVGTSFGSTAAVELAEAV